MLKMSFSTGAIHAPSPSGCRRNVGTKARYHRNTKAVHLSVETRKCVCAIIEQPLPSVFKAQAQVASCVEHTISCLPPFALTQCAAFVPVGESNPKGFPLHGAAKARPSGLRPLPPHAGNRRNDDDAPTVLWFAAQPPDADRSYCRAELDDVIHQIRCARALGIRKVDDGWLVDYKGERTPRRAVQRPLPQRIEHDPVQRPFEPIR